MKIAVGTDHRGFAIKEYLIAQPRIADLAITWLDVGAHDDERSDYPMFAERVCHAILNQDVNKGILLCGTGVGMAIAANRFPGIYAAVVWNEEVAALSASDDKANVLSLPADYLSKEYVVEIIGAWLTTHFKEGRYQERITMIDSLLIK